MCRKIAYALNLPFVVPHYVSLCSFMYIVSLADEQPLEQH